MSDETNQRRRHERFAFHNSVILLLADGRELYGTADNMGFGGASMTVTGEPPEIQAGSEGTLKVVFFGRPADYPCTIVSANGTKLGIKIHRADYNGAPEALLQVKK
ncbi:MAG: PilZ domain-containing protein [Magnetococcales bacterium]|nr:PilZ domain-containing protein [Magnetococcales bacterium]MBF0438622.1 PilZ domain-containing protein [Magnetococcales bacterium]